jgi:hypothetical protein
MNINTNDYENENQSRNNNAHNKIGLKNNNQISSLPLIIKKKRLIFSYKAYNCFNKLSFLFSISFLIFSISFYFGGQYILKYQIHQVRICIL